MNTQQEQLIVKLKPRASRMFLPTLVLAAVSFSLAFVAEQLSQPDYELVLIAGAALVFLFWFLPLAAYMLSYLELTDKNLTIRYGFLGFRKRQLALVELSSIELQKAGVFSNPVISILSVEGDELLVGGYARTKLLATEIESLAKLAS